MCFSALIQMVEVIERKLNYVKKNYVGETAYFMETWIRAMVCSGVCMRFSLINCERCG